jgi:hypothetical protein
MNTLGKVFWASYMVKMCAYLRMDRLAREKLIRCKALFWKAGKKLKKGSFREQSKTSLKGSLTKN